MYIVPKMLGDSGSSKDSKMIEKLRDEIKDKEIGWEYQKTIWVMQFLVCDENEIEQRVQGNEYGIKLEDIQKMIHGNTQTNFYAG